MKTLISLSLKYLKRQKLRTLLTFISIVIGVFTIFTGFLFTTSMGKTFYETEVEQNGEFEINIDSYLRHDENVEEKIKKVGSHYLTENYYSVMFYEFAHNKNVNVSCEKGEVQELNFVHLNSVNGNKNNQNKVNVYYIYIKNENGIVLPDSFEKMGYKINDTIELTFSSDDNKKVLSSDKYVIEDFSVYRSEEPAVFYVRDNDNLLKDYYETFSSDFTYKDCYDFLIIKKGMFQSYRKNFETIIKDCGLEKDDINFDDCAINIPRLFLTGKYIINEDTVTIIVPVVIFFILFILYGAFIIKNAFETSVFERIQKYNTLRMIGASKEQLTAMTVIEAVIYCIAAFPVGCILSVISVKTLFSSFNGIIKGMEVSYSFVWYIQLIGILLCILIVLTSSCKTVLSSAEKYSLSQTTDPGFMLKSEKRNNIPENSSVKKLIKTYSGRNLKRTGGKYLFSGFCCMVCAFILSAAVFYFIGSKFETTVNSENYIDLSAVDYRLNIYNSITENQLNEILEPVRTECNIEIENRYYYSVIDVLYYPNANINNSINFVSSSENEQYYEIMEKYASPYYNKGSFDIYVTDRKEYEELYFPYTNISYDEVLEQKYIIINHWSNKNKGYYSFKDMGYANAPDFFKNDLDFKIMGYLESDAVSNGVVFPVELTSDFYMHNTYVNITELEGHDHEKISSLIYEIEDKYLGTINYIMDLNLERIIMKKRIKTYKELFAVMIIFFMLSGIVSLMNTTNTKILNNTREYFIFRCSGMSRKNIVKTVLREIILFSGIAFSVGSVIGLLFVLFTNEAIASSSYLLLILIITVPVLLILYLLYISLPVLSSVPLIKKLFHTSTEIVNSNAIR